MERPFGPLVLSRLARMYLSQVELAGFQSYSVPQTIVFEPHVTLLVGRNNVGKSALLRGLALLEQPQSGLQTQFALSLTWVLDGEMLRDVVSRLNVPPELEQSISAEIGHPFRVRYAPIVAVRAGESATLGPGQLVPIEYELPTLGWHAEGEVGRKAGWLTGFFEGGATGIDAFEQLARQLESHVRYIAPRRIDAGRKAMRQTRRLDPDARNLTEVVAFIGEHERFTTLDAVERVRLVSGARTTDAARCVRNGRSANARARGRRFATARGPSVPDR
jgi:energy-coupling factor transporter ATP-binding protein EcfA2